MDKARARHWNQRYSEPQQLEPEACYALRQYSHLLPTDEQGQPAGEALDLACGRGGNALYLAELGFATHAWDISEVVIAALAERASAKSLPLTTLCRDVVAEAPPPASFDVIVVSRFLQRSLVPALIAALRPGGVLFYQTFTRQGSSGPSRPEYLLQENELLELFAALRIRAFEDAGLCGQQHRGFRNESLIVAHKV